MEIQEKGDSKKKEINGDSRKMEIQEKGD